MPFVRGARGGEGSQYDTAAKKPASNPTPAAQKTSAPQKAAATPAAKVETGPGADVAAAIVAAGDKVRDLKAAKADKAEIKAKVDELLALKVKYQEVTGKAYAPGAAPVAAKAAKTEKAAPKKEEPKKMAPAAAAPKKARVTAPSTVWSAGKVDIALLEARLKVFSYVGGYAPSVEDNKVLEALGGEVYQSPAVNTNRWLRNVKSFAASQRSAW